MTVTEATMRTLEVPGATLAYDVRPGGSTDEPPLFLVGLPMAAPGFATLAGHFADRTVITYDPRGSERSTKADPMSSATPDDHADDLHRIIREVGGPVDLFGTSGGAITGLALVAKHPEDVRTIVAHEPPLASVLPDRENAMAVTRAVGDTYQSKGFGAGMAHFIAAVSHKGEFPNGFAEQPAPDPTMFGMPAEDDGSRTDGLLGSNNMVNTTHYEPDFDALRGASTRIILAAGEDSDGEMAERGAVAVAERLGIETVRFPGDHGGFFGGEYGQVGKPEQFAARLREVLAQ
jgi:pimeloyl-ACP methyl ester carboxylesterase